MAFIQETTSQSDRRIWQGRLAALLAVSWWVLSVGGIIYVVATT